PPTTRTVPTRIATRRRRFCLACLRTSSSRSLRACSLRSAFVIRCGTVGAPPPVPPLLAIGASDYQPSLVRGCAGMERGAGGYTQPPDRPSYQGRHDTFEHPPRFRTPLGRPGRGVLRQGLPLRP